MELTNKIALITGGRRIGAVVAAALAQYGTDVALSYATSHTEAERAVERVQALGRRGAAFRADVSQPEACDELIAAVVERFGGLDILVNMASVYVAKPFDELRTVDWDLVLNVDLRAAFLCARAAASHMRSRGGGRIVNFSDWTARSGRPRYPGFLPYYVAK